jgi:iron(II)-dependent oxidoreductase
MGSFARSDDEQPINQQCFNVPFWIDKTEVTQGQFSQFKGKMAKKPHFTGDNRPVEEITWFEARDFCDSRKAHLPTEVEWEYAASGPDSLAYPWGNTFDSSKAIWNKNSWGQTADVGISSARASWVGAVDMVGNVLEWTSSIYKPYPYDATDGRENEGDIGGNRVLRGGSWNLAPDELRTTVRFDYSPFDAGIATGFRCARSD